MADREVRRVGAEVRLARVASGVSQESVAEACGLSRPKVGRIERGESRSLSIADLFACSMALGLDVSLRLYPGRRWNPGAGQLRLLERLRQLTHAALKWATEVPLPIAGDRRAWDAAITGRGFRIGVEAETRLSDAQALARKIALKGGDGDVTSVILLVADTRRNRELHAVVAAALGIVTPSRRSTRCERLPPAGTRAATGSCASDGRQPVRIEGTDPTAASIAVARRSTMSSISASVTTNGGPRRIRSPSTPSALPVPE